MLPTMDISEYMKSSERGVIADLAAPKRILRGILSYDRAYHENYGEHWVMNYGEVEALLDQ
jgi:hypothetical protein